MKAKKIKNLVQSNQDAIEPLASVVNTRMNRRTFVKVNLAATVLVAGASLAITSKPLQVTTTSTQQQQSVSADPFALQTITLNVNGADYMVSVEPRDMLGNVLREDIRNHRHKETM